LDSICKNHGHQHTQETGYELYVTLFRIKKFVDISLVPQSFYMYGPEDQKDEDADEAFAAIWSDVAAGKEQQQCDNDNGIEEEQQQPVDEEKQQGDDEDNDMELTMKTTMRTPQKMRTWAMMIVSHQSLIRKMCLTMIEIKINRRMLPIPPMLMNHPLYFLRCLRCLQQKPSLHRKLPNRLHWLLAMLPSPY
jgi:hypothetical protein